MDDRNSAQIAGCLEQLAVGEDVARMVGRAALHEGEKWVTASWLQVRLGRTGLHVTRSEVSMVLDDMDVRRRQGGDVRSSLSHLRQLALDGEIAAYIEGLKRARELLQPAPYDVPLPVVADSGGDSAARGCRGRPKGAFALEALEGAKNRENGQFEH